MENQHGRFSLLSLSFRRRSIQSASSSLDFGAISVLCLLCLLPNPILGIREELGSRENLPSFLLNRVLAASPQPTGWTSRREDARISRRHTKEKQRTSSRTSSRQTETRKQNRRHGPQHRSLRRGFRSQSPKNQQRLGPRVPEASPGKRHPLRALRLCLQLR